MPWLLGSQVIINNGIDYCVLNNWVLIFHEERFESPYPHNLLSAEKWEKNIFLFPYKKFPNQIKSSLLSYWYKVKYKNQNRFNT